MHLLDDPHLVAGQNAHIKIPVARTGKSSRKAPLRDKSSGQNKAIVAKTFSASIRSKTVVLHTIRCKGRIGTLRTVFSFDLLKDAFRYGSPQPAHGLVRWVFQIIERLCGKNPGAMQAVVVHRGSSHYAVSRGVLSRPFRGRFH